MLILQLQKKTLGNHALFLKTFFLSSCILVPGLCSTFKYIGNKLNQVFYLNNIQWFVISRLLSPWRRSFKSSLSKEVMISSSHAFSKNNDTVHIPKLLQSFFTNLRNILCAFFVIKAKIKKINSKSISIFDELADWLFFFNLFFVRGILSI